MRPTGVLLGGTATAVLVLDQVTKALVRTSLSPGESIPLFGGLVDLTYVRNTGAAFSLLEGRQWLFATVSVVFVSIMLAWWWRERPEGRWLNFGMGLLAGGAVGNLIDRVFIGAVTDFVDVHFWPVFNVADSAVLVGVGVLMVHILLEDRAAARAANGEER